MEEVQTFYQTHQVFLLILGGLIAVALCLPWHKTDNWEWLDFIPHRRGRMLRKARRQFIKQDAVDGFVSYVEDQVYHGTYTRDEAKELYREMKKTFPIRDLFPSPRLLKEAIRKRLASGIHTPVSLPDLKEKKKRKHAFDKA